MRRLTVLNVAYPLAAAGPDAVGGAEQVLSLVETAVARAGHTSLVVAAEGSNVAGTLIATPLPRGALTDEVRVQVQQRHHANLCRALELHRVDVVHLHGVDFHAYLPPAGVPTLITLHLPPSWYPPEIFRLARPDTFLHCVSASQQRACPPAANLLGYVENGVPIAPLRSACASRRYALALGRVCAEKSFHVALDAGRRSGIPVLLGGQVFPYPAHEQYFREQILPRLDGKSRFLGPLGLEQKRRLLTGARCLVSASVAPETSCLVAMEAMACGTPVVAFPSGAVPEIVEHGVTGFLVNSEVEMAEAMLESRRIDPEVCRETARRRFSAERMTAQYLALYRELADGQLRKKLTGASGAAGASGRGEA